MYNPMRDGLPGTTPACWYGTPVWASGPSHATSLPGVQPPLKIGRPPVNPAGMLPVMVPGLPGDDMYQHAVGSLGPVPQGGVGVALHVVAGDGGSGDGPPPTVHVSASEHVVGLYMGVPFAFTYSTYSQACGSSM